MPNKKWTESRQLEQSLGIDGVSLRELYEQLTSAGCEDIRTIIYLPLGEQQIFSSSSDLNELLEIDFRQVTRISVLGRSPDASISLCLSKKSHYPSFAEIEGFDRNQIHLLNGICKDFEDKHKISDSSPSNKFVINEEDQRDESQALALNLHENANNSETSISISKKIRKLPDELPDAKLLSR